MRDTLGGKPVIRSLMLNCCHEDVSRARTSAVFMSCSTVAKMVTSWEKTDVTDKLYVRTTPSLLGFTV